MSPIKKLSHFFIATLLICHGIDMNQFFGQDTQVYFEHITTEQGLSQNDINCIYQDSKGFIWFGTHDGLNKYDGYDFKIYKPQSDYSNSISSNLIYAISGSKRDALWIGTTGAGINHFNSRTEKFTHIRHNSLDTTSLASDYIYTLLEDSSGRLWVGTNQGLCLWENADIGKSQPIFHRFSGKKAAEVGLAEEKIHSIYEDPTGILWFGSNMGLFKLQEKNGDFYFSKRYGGDLLASSFISAILTDQFGKLIVATNRGLFYAKNENNFIRLSSSVFQDIILDHNKHIWAGSRQGIYRFSFNKSTLAYQMVVHYQNTEFDANSINKNLIKSMITDKNGVIWIGTNGGGINKVDPRKKPFRHFRNEYQVGSLNENKIRAVFEDSQGTLWIGTEGGGLYYQLANGQEGNYQQFPTLASTNIFALNETQIEGKPHLLIGAAESNPGLYSFPLNQASLANKQLPETTQITEVTGSVFTIFKSKTGKIWVGTYTQGLFCLKYDHLSNDFHVSNFQHFSENAKSLSSNIVRSITEDKAGNLWIGTGVGLNKLSLSEQDQLSPSFDIYNHSKNSGSISHNYILSLFYSDKEELWIGTFGGGINKYIAPADTFQIVGTQEGLPNDVIKGILEDDHGNLWLASNKGLTKFTPSTGQIVNYDTNDGLQSNEFSELASFRRRNGDMIFGGVNGLNTFFPDSIQNNPHLPTAVLTNFHILNKPIGVGDIYNGRVILESSISELDNLTLKHHENSFSFEFSALHYAAPQKNQYAFRLEGLEADWVYVTSERRFANYTNLRHGTYRFLVKASNNDGIWTETPTVLKIEILPPFWLTWWAYVLYTIILALLLIAFRRYTIIGINEKHQLVLQKLEKERAEELQQLKLRFFTNISHEIRTPLTLIAGPIDQLMTKGKKLSGHQVQDHYNLIKRNTDYLLRLINQLLDFRKVDQGNMQLNIALGDIVSFVHEVMEPFQFMADKKQIDYTFHAKSTVLSAYFDIGILEKALYNLLSNAFKFTPDHGSISIHLSLEEAEHGNQSFARIDVKDTGPGISLSKQKVIFDRFFKAAKSSYENKEGVGIGLSFTKSLITLHKGKIWVESVEGQGSCFSMMIPISPSVYGISQVEAVHQIEHSPRKIDIDKVVQNKNEDVASNQLLPLLLLVDDHEDIRYYIKNGLQDTYRIIEAKNGQEGLETAEKQLPDLIISDVMMPELNGIDMCERLKHDPNTSHIPIILLTAKVSEENELMGLKSGADDYLRKPFRLEILRTKIQNILAYREELHKRFRKEVLLDPKEITATSADEVFLKDAVALVEANMDNPAFNVEEMVQQIGMSRSKFYLKIKALTGQSSSEFIRTIRLKRAAQLFERSDYSVKEIMYMTGFSTASYFSKCFKEQFGMTPSEFLIKKKAAEVDD